MNETLKIIAERYSCRDFKKDVIPDDKYLNAVAKAAISAPSGMNRQNWHVIVVKNNELISEMEAEGMKILASMEDKSAYERIMSRGGKLFYNAPCMIFMAVKPAEPKGAELIDLGILAENTVLAATSLGLASLHCGLAVFPFAGSRAAEFKEKLKIPEGYECGMAVLLGYANTVSSPHALNQEKITIIE